jgi:hypothetical protein
MLVLLGGCTMNGVVSNTVNTQYQRKELTETMGQSEYFVEGLIIPSLGNAREMTVGHPDNAPRGNSPFANPPNYNLQLAIEKGLTTSDAFEEKYLYMQALYRKTFENWLLEVTSLREFNDRLENSGLDFIPVPERRQDFQQRHTSMDLKYVFLANTIPIERLGEDDLALLYSMIQDGRSDITCELTEMVARTFSDVLMAFPHLGDDVGCGFRPSGGGGPPSPNRSIVLVIQEWAFNEEGAFRDSIENNGKRIDYMEELAKEMESVLSEQISHRVIVHVEL